MVSAISFQCVSKHFGEVRAVDSVSFEVEAGEFFALLGPSGSGKTTCLRLLAGFEQPSSGHIELFGETAEGVPPYRRSVNTVFQDYALFPHMSVLENVAYGLMVSGVARAERERRSHEALALVKLEGMDARRPAQLSGGQRQRVALARALVNRPKALLLDEPLGALDLKLREQMQLEIKALQQQLGITFVFVTHDQGEALSMADRVAIFDNGRLVQTGTPREVYERPQTRFVASFVGSSNILDPEFSARHGGTKTWASLRPESIRAFPADDQRQADTDEVRTEGFVTAVQYQGATTRLLVDVENTSLSVALPVGETPGAVGERVVLSWRPQALHTLESG
jgi:putative spermidine/putrescine transport system ATP-binding protein